jgi:hypothetical protein
MMATCVGGWIGLDCLRNTNIGPQLTLILLFSTFSSTQTADIYPAGRARSGRESPRTLQRPRRGEDGVLNIFIFSGALLVTILFPSNEVVPEMYRLSRLLACSGQGETFRLTAAGLGALGRVEERADFLPTDLLFRNFLTHAGKHAVEEWERALFPLVETCGRSVRVSAHPYWIK